MLWLTWRQHRMQILVTAGLLLGLGLVLLVHGLGNTDLAARFATNHEALVIVLGERFGPLISVIDWLVLAPAVVGLFWGAPVLAREFERGTHKLAWTQSVPRARWLAVKLGGLSAVVTLAGLAFGLMIGAWLSSFDPTHYSDRFSGPPFVLSGVVPAAWWLFAFAVGVAAGAVIRRILPAIAVTLVVVVGATLVFFLSGLREGYAEPERAIVNSQQEMDLVNSGAWIIATSFVDATGREVPPDNCAGVPGTRCLPESDTRRVVEYHPASRYWRFQWTETGIVLAAALVMGGLGVHRASRRTG